MTKFISMFLIFIFLSSPHIVYHKNNDITGKSRIEFVRAVKAREIVLKKSKVGKTLLVYDTAVPKKRVNAVRSWIKILPSNVQKSVKRVYFLSRKHYNMTGKRSWIKGTYGYFLHDSKEIYFYPVSDTDELKDTLYHEFGHAWDSHSGKPSGISGTKKWKQLADINGTSSVEYFAISFADYWIFMGQKENALIKKTLIQKEILKWA